MSVVVFTGCQTRGAGRAGWCGREFGGCGKVVGFDRVGFCRTDG